jgi:hypothetical protein
MSSSRRAERLPSARLVLAAAHADPQTFAHAVEAANGQVDWPWVIERAHRHKVAALLARRIDEAEIDRSLPAGVRRELDTVRAAAAIRASQCQRTFAMVAETLEAARIPFLLIKGGVLAEHVYRQPSVRPFYDIDVLVREEDLEEGARVMRAAGFDAHRVSVRFMRKEGLNVRGDAEHRVDPETTRAVYRRFHFHWKFVPPDGRGLVPVEIHWHLYRPGYYRIDADELWQSTRVLEVSGCEAPTLGVHETIVHLCTHALVDYPYLFRVLHLADVAWAIDRWSDDLDPHRLHETAVRWGGEGDLAVALAAARDFLHAGGVLPFAPRLSAWQRFCLNRAATECSLVEMSNPPDKMTRPREAMRRRTFWDLARGRSPIPVGKGRTKVAEWVKLARGASRA